MFTLEELQKRLPVGALGEPFHYFETIGSTNDKAIELAGRGAEDGTLVLADEQTAGRGRMDRRWSTPRGTALAFSLILRPQPLTVASLAALNVLGALAVVEAVETLGLTAVIKWPNDVLIAERKVAGVLVETSWRGEELEFAVVGIGLNVKEGSSPPNHSVRWPATSLEQAGGQPVGRLPLLVVALGSLDRWLPQLGAEELRIACERRLAYQGQRVQVQGRTRTVEGTLLGLGADGRLRIRGPAGEEQVVGHEYLSLRPLDRDAS